ncbi:MAG TPA: prenyltransferase [Candidatus Bathyarchaeia archaeon]|nr:prenyltransferase [Candidatus Bathyarchaeia archaeon]
MRLRQASYLENERNIIDLLMDDPSIMRIRVWWRAFRYHFVPPSIFPAVLGGLIGWSIDHQFSPRYFFLVLVAIIINHIGLNMTDDYFDYKNAVDTLKPGEKNPYTGGSGVLSSGRIKPASMFKAFVICYLITASVGVYLTLARGLPVLAFGLVGVFCSVFYTAPPISFSHHGLGELALLINFGPVIGLGAYFVQTQRLGLEAFLATLPMGIMLFSMIVINEIPDDEEDKKAGKLTLVARYGKKAGIKLYVLSWFFTYAIIIGAVTLKIIPVFTLVALLSLPLVATSIRKLRVYYNDPILIAPANLDMIKAHAITCLGLIAGYSAQGLLSGADAFQLIFILLLLALAYAPVAIALVGSSKR